MVVQALVREESWKVLEGNIRVWVGCKNLRGKKGSFRLCNLLDL